MFNIEIICKSIIKDVNPLYYDNNKKSCINLIKCNILNYLHYLVVQAYIINPEVNISANNKTIVAIITFKPIDVYLPKETIIVTETIITRDELIDRLHESIKFLELSIIKNNI